MVWVILANFINLSVNFQEANLSPSDQIDLSDPIDTLGELVYEWVLDGDEDVIPDNGTEQEEKNTKKDKHWFSKYADYQQPNLFFYQTTTYTEFTSRISEPKLPGIFSPPELN